MATGKIKNWIGDRGFGFITDETGGQDVFFHINGSPDLRGEEESLVPGKVVVFDKRPSERHPGRFEARNVRLQEASPLTQQTTDFGPSTDETHEHFYNPYTFVPSPPRQKAIRMGGFAGDFDPLKCGLDHASLNPQLWTGHIPIKLTTVTPLVLPKTGGEKRDLTQHQTYDVLDYIPESSLRGMLRSAYEVVTNSRYGGFGKDHKEKLAYRMDTREAPKLVPAIIKKGNKPGKLVAYLYTGTSTPTPRGPKRSRSDWEGAMYAAMLDQGLKYVSGGVPKTGDTVWAEIVLCEHRRPFYLYWKATQVWLTKKQPNKPAQNNPNVRIVKGHVFITNKNIKNKHDERIFFYDSPKTQQSFPLTGIHEEAWEKLIKNYREAHTDNEIFKRKGAIDEPWKNIGDDPGETAWSPHLYQDNTHRSVWRNDPHGRSTEHDAIRLQEGDMVYARCEFNKGEIISIKDLFPVTISRELYEKSPEDLLDSSLQPAKALDEFSPADRLFGWVPQNTERDDDTVPENEGGYKSRIRVVCEGGPQPGMVQDFDGGNLPLTILGQPKPAQGRFYVAKNKHGIPQKDNLSKEDAGYNKDKGLRGRKQYWHHKGLPSGYWNLSVKNSINGRYQEYRRHGGKKDPQNRSITGWIKPDTKFKASLYVQNLQPEEVGALLWLLSLPEGHYFKLGYGKPLGFGSVKIEIDWNHADCQNQCLPLANGKDWQEYYRTFDADTVSLAKLDYTRQEEYIQEFQSMMKDAYKKTTFDRLPFISGFLRVLAGPTDDLPIHYPRLEHTPHPEGKNFDWFTTNERGRGRHEDGQKRALPEVTDDKGLPYKPTKLKKR